MSDVPFAQGAMITRTLIIGVGETGKQILAELQLLIADYGITLRSANITQNPLDYLTRLVWVTEDTSHTMQATVLSRGYENEPPILDVTSCLQDLWLDLQAVNNSLKNQLAIQNLQVNDIRRMQIIVGDVDTDSVMRVATLATEANQRLGRIDKLWNLAFVCHATEQAYNAIGALPLLHCQWPRQVFIDGIMLYESLQDRKENYPLPIIHAIIAEAIWLLIATALPNTTAFADFLDKIRPSPGVPVLPVGCLVGRQLVYPHAAIQEIAATYLADAITTVALTEKLQRSMPPIRLAENLAVPPDDQANTQADDMRKLMTVRPANTTTRRRRPSPEILAKPQLSAVLAPIRAQAQTLVDHLQTQIKVLPDRSEKSLTEAVHTFEASQECTQWHTVCQQLWDTYYQDVADEIDNQVRDQLLNPYGRERTLSYLKRLRFLLSGMNPANRRDIGSEWLERELNEQNIQLSQDRAIVLGEQLEIAQKETASDPLATMRAIANVSEGMLKGIVGDQQVIERAVGTPVVFVMIAMIFLTTLVAAPGDVVPLLHQYFPQFSALAIIASALVPAFRALQKYIVHRHTLQDAQPFRGAARLCNDIEFIEVSSRLAFFAKLNKFLADSIETYQLSWREHVKRLHESFAERRDQRVARYTKISMRRNTPQGIAVAFDSVYAENGPLDDIATLARHKAEAYLKDTPIHQDFARSLQQWMTGRNWDVSFRDGSLQTYIYHFALQHMAEALTATPLQAFSTL